jgi:hypothetical protein
VIVGINQPWWLSASWGQDFGGRPRGGTAPFWAAGLPAVLDEYVALGFSAVRWWIYAAGATLEPQPVRRPMSSPFGPTANWVPPGPPARVPEQDLADFEAMLVLFRQKGLFLLPCLLSFEFFEDGRPWGTRVKGGRSNWLHEPGGMPLLLRNVVEPFVERAARYSDVIFAFEIVNEPEWCTEGGTRPYVARSAMQLFLSSACALVVRNRMRATIGYAHTRTPGEWGALGATAVQTHHYGKQLIPLTLGSGPPRNTQGPGAFIGETSMSVAHPYQWREPGTNTLPGRLTHLESLGYDATFLWSHPKDDIPDHQRPDTEDWRPETRNAVRDWVAANRATRLRRPPQRPGPPP